MSLRLRLAGLLGVLFALLVGTALVVVSALHTVETNQDLVTGHLQPASVQSRAMLVALVDQETGQRGYVITGDNAFLQPYRAGRRQFGTSVRRLRSEVVGDPRLTRDLAGVRAAARRWHRLGAGPEIAARRAGDAATARRLVRAGVGKQAFDRVRARVDDLQSLIDARADRAQRQAVLDASELRRLVLTRAALLALFFVFSAVLLQRWALAPVLALRASMRTVADGDLAHPVAAAGPPEIAAIGRDAESMRRRIVAELDRARAATEALSQHSPVVAGLRRELVTPSRSMTPGLRVAGRLLSAEGVLAGDWWETVLRPDGSTALVVADVSGHGAEAGLVAARFKHRLTALLDTDLDLLQAFDVAARGRDGDDERFLSCLLVAVHPEQHRLRWVNAGHPPGLLLGPGGTGLRELTPTGPLISSLSAGWSVAEDRLGPDDLLVVCTDGVLDARDAAGAEFGVQGVLDVVRGLRRPKPEQVVAECTEAVRRFAVDVRRDDVTCVALDLET